MSDLYFPPDRVNSLDEVPEDFHECYKAHKDSLRGFVMTREARELRDEHVATVARLQADHKAATSSFEAKLTARDKELADHTIRGALTAALSGRVRLDLQKAAIAILMQTQKFNVEESDFEGEGSVVAVHGPMGLEPVDYAVSAWLASDEAAPFRAQPTLSGGGEFAAMVERLKRF